MVNVFHKLEMIRKGELSCFENVEQFLELIEKRDKKGERINSFLHVNENALEEARRIDEKIRKGEKVGRLAGLAIGVKSNVHVKGMITNCASLVLENYRAPYDATVIAKIRKEDGIILGMTNMDEFACGGSGETSAFGATRNPHNLALIPGGSSSGSGAAVVAGFCDLALGSDTGGSIRNPASHCGVVGIKPSYGLVSRYGLIDLSMSLDQVGTFSKDVSGAGLLLDVIRGKDTKDAISYESSQINIEGGLKNITVGIPGIAVNDQRILDEMESIVSEVTKKNGWKVRRIKLQHIGLAVQTYYPLVYVEFFSGTRRFDGRRYGKKIEEVAGPEVLRRILGGSEISKAEYKGLYYRRALRAKEVIKKEFESAFKEVDAILMPTVPRLPHKIGSRMSVEEMYNYDPLTIPANLAEVCCVSVPCMHLDGVPVGIEVHCGKLQEGKMLAIAREFERVKEK